ncbi:hypothetical protein VUR80DRAFT_1373 [Thermomyces stellatus]
MTDQPPAQAAPAADSEESKSARVTLADICAQGAAHFAHKKYDDAAECYARAAEMQAELNGEMDPSNAEVLFLYGRSLFKVGQGKSDVLGGKAGAAERERGVEKGVARRVVSEKGQDIEKKAGEEVKKDEVEKKEEGKKEGEVSEEKKPLFQFTGDENWDDSDEDEEDGEPEAQEEEDDDLATAFGVLDLARVLFSKRLEQLEASGDKEHDEPTIRHVKERLADTHDLLSEISLENESYPAAITDARASLNYKKALHPPESEVLAEAHFKLSLALEYASVTTTEEEAGAAGVKGESVVDQEQRDEACKELQAAIDSTKLKMGIKEKELEATPEDESEGLKGEISNLKDIIGDMEDRLNDLRGPPINLNESLFGPKGLLGAAGGASSSKIEDAKKNATDLSSLVRKKAKDEGGGSNGKRKAEGDGDSETGGESPKKARVEDA